MTDWTWLVWAGPAVMALGLVSAARSLWKDGLVSGLGAVAFVIAGWLGIALPVGAWLVDETLFHALALVAVGVLVGCVLVHRRRGRMGNV